MGAGQCDTHFLKYKQKSAETGAALSTLVKSLHCIGTFLACAAIADIGCDAEKHQCGLFGSLRCVIHEWPLFLTIVLCRLGLAKAQQIRKFRT